MIGEIREFSTRWTKPVPLFFQKLRKVGLTIAGIGAALLAAPVSLPAIAITLAGYAITAGTVITLISQVTVDDNPPEAEDFHRIY
ncbi:hypothetical protein [Rhodonellum sp.]|uniref:hypothetical protein n=1 Tax=Rhodonellum sp. TaxID=2231180 RepID=UPI002722C3D4|nr:hypothetical protein [Rhodonellum sp.]MDO9552228.1 hypothetical protein [Rhodonellum sp.]